VTLFETLRHPHDRLDKGMVGDMMRIDYNPRHTVIRVVEVARTCRVRTMIQALACSLALTFHKIVDLESSMEVASTWQESIPSHYRLRRSSRKSMIAVKAVLPYIGPVDEARTRGSDGDVGLE